MIFTDHILFIHVPKMAGMTLTTYLLNDLIGQITLSVPPAARKHALDSLRFPDVVPRLAFHDGIRHEDLSGASEVLAQYGKTLGSFKKIIALVRDPYELEKSYYAHMQKKSVQALRGAKSLAVQLAQSADFDSFAERAPFYGHSPSRIERFYTLANGEMPSNMEIVRFEDLASFVRLVEPYCYGREPLGHANKSSTEKKEAIVLSERAERAVQAKYEFLFRFYPKQVTASAAAG